MAYTETIKEEDSDIWMGTASETGEHSPIVGTPIDEALKLFAEWRADGDQASDIILDTLTYMKGSPSYKQFIRAAQEPVTRIPEDPEWNLAWSHATMICVGILIARREVGRREAQPDDAKWDM